MFASSLSSTLSAPWRACAELSLGTLSKTKELPAAKE
jgi:hypothetical protein